MQYRAVHRRRGHAIGVDLLVRFNGWWLQVGLHAMGRCQVGPVTALCSVSAGYRPESMNLDLLVSGVEVYIHTFGVACAAPT